MPDPLLVGGIDELSERYDGFIVDQWGVLHDGSFLFPEAVDALRRLRDRAKHVVLLSNTGRRLAFNRRRLDAMGLGDGEVDDIVTAGETAWQLLRAGIEPFGALGRRCLLWDESGDRSILEGLDLEPVDRVEDAAFILLAGIPRGARPDDLLPELEAAAARRLPMICCNPDRVVVIASGVIPATGTIATLYEQRGGLVHYVGKPYPAVYQACLEALGPIVRGRIVAIGDSLAHDIAGGAGAGVATALVLAGIHADDLGPDPEAGSFEPALARLIQEHGAQPDFILPRFAWSGRRS